MKSLAILLGLALGLAVVWYDQTIPAQAEVVADRAKPTAVPSKATGSGFNYQATKIAAGRHIRLLSNFEASKSFAALVAGHGCTLAINGGFYDTDSKPLGWLVADGQLQKKPRSSRLFDGFIYQTPKAPAAIARLAPDAAEWGVQTGPILVENGKTIKLSIQNDKFARRMVMGLTAERQVVWLAIYNRESVFDGPKLADLPGVVREIDSLENLDMETAVNLDGGTASAFYTPELQLYEFNPVGSVLCAS